MAAERRPSRFAQYHTVLKAISKRTGTSLPSLITSFAILHEVTAVLPAVGIYYGAKHYGLGEYCIALIQSGDEEKGSLSTGTSSSLSPSTPRWKLRAQEWLGEGQIFMERVGRRYDLWNVREAEARQDRPLNSGQSELLVGLNTRGISGDIANAIFAYGVTKALLPVRVGMSLWLSPMFSRRIIDPVGSFIKDIFRKVK